MSTSTPIADPNEVLLITDYVFALGLLYSPAAPTAPDAPPSHSELSEGAKVAVGVAVAASVAALIAAVMVGWCWCVRVKKASQRASTGGMSARRKRFTGNSSFFELEERDGNGGGGDDGLARKAFYAGKKIEEPTLV